MDVDSGILQFAPQSRCMDGTSENIGRILSHKICEVGGKFEQQTPPQNFSKEEIDRRKNYGTIVGRAVSHAM